MTKDLTHYFHIKLRVGDDFSINKFLLDLGKEEKLKKRFMRKILEAPGIQVKYYFTREKMNGINIPMKYTHVDLYSENIEKIMPFYSKIEKVVYDFDQLLGFAWIDKIPKQKK